MTDDELSVSSRRNFLKYTIAGVAVAGAAAVAGSAYYKYSYAPSHTQRTPVKIGAFGVAGDTPTYVANDLGLFEKHGVDAELISFQSAPQELDALQANKVDIVDESLPAMLLAAASTGYYGRLIHPLSWLGTYNGKNYPYVVALVRSDLTNTIKSIKDLKGASIGTAGLATFDQSTVNVVLKKAGLDPSKDVSFVTLTYPNMVEALATKHIDAALNVALPFWYLAVQKGYAQILNDPVYDPNGLTYVAGLGTPVTMVSGLWASDTFLKANQGGCSGIMSALSDAVVSIQNNPDQAASILAKHTGLSQELAQFSMQNILFRAYAKGFTDWQNYLPAIQNTLVSNGLLKAPLDLKQFLTTSCFSP